MTRSCPRLGAAVCLLLASCGVRQPSRPSAAGEVVFAGAVQDLAPLHDGDHYVYRAARGDEDWRLHVEHVSALEESGEFLISLTEDGTLVSKLHVQARENDIVIRSAVYPQEDHGFMFIEPLPYLAMPLRRGVQHASSRALLWQISDGKTLAEGSVEQSMTAEPGAPEDGRETIAIRTERTLRFPVFTLPSGRSMALTVHNRGTTWVSPGVGEIRSEDGSLEGPPLRRELLCATIAGRRVSDCDKLQERLQR